ncbi:universal stress protein [Rhodocytophaga aerolata]|uniref:Universal stress protein n=1 Tax=Rhodocytophaga aerolata TaxID=455078 RepID=A0ABT8R4T9_9BACT|nr:universal stress protein [Rhodocytophaga aerolata]MDO1446711.1 universal stress protein [Rhodocytophaga aerolata]
MKTIVCPTDFSTCATNALAYAHQVAIQAQAELILLHTLFSPDAMPYAGITLESTYGMAEVDSNQNQLEQLCQQLRASNHTSGVRYQTILGTRPAPDEIAHTAATHHADLIVMGTEGAYGVKELLLGSTAASVIDTTTVPVLIVPDQAIFQPIKTIVFAADLTEKHPCDVAALTAIARLFDAHILFLHVLKENSSVKSNLAHLHYADLYSGIGYKQVSFHIREESDIERGILQFSQEKQAGLIVMINHKRSLLESIFTGSQTKKMAYHTPIPLLAIHTN